MTLERKPNYIAEVTLSLDTSIYASGDVLAATQAIDGGYIPGGSNHLKSVALLDKDDQAGDLDLIFLRSDQSIGTENAAMSLTDAQAEEILAIVPIVAADYLDFGDGQLAMLQAPDTGFDLILQNADLSDSALYIAAVSRDTKTYTIAGIVLKLGMERSY